MLDISLERVLVAAIVAGLVMAVILIIRRPRKYTNISEVELLTFESNVPPYPARLKITPDMPARISHVITRLEFRFEQLLHTTSPKTFLLLHETWRKIEYFKQAAKQIESLNAEYARAIHPLTQADLVSALSAERQNTLEQEARDQELYAQRRKDREQRERREKRRDRLIDLLINIVLAVFSLVAGWLLSSLIHLPF